jgi:hypothetical protein
MTKTFNSLGIVVISLDFSFTFTCPKLSWLALAWTLTV